MIAVMSQTRASKTLSRENWTAVTRLISNSKKCVTLVMHFGSCQHCWAIQTAQL